MNRTRHFIFALLFLWLAAASQGSAEEVRQFCSQTCGLWPKLCATATACMKVCQTPHRLLKTCRGNKVAVDTTIPDISFTKQQFCDSVCTPYPLMCSSLTYCIQNCGTKPAIMKSCIDEKHAVDTKRPRITG